MPILSGFELAKLVRESACNKATPLVIENPGTGRFTRTFARYEVVPPNAAEALRTASTTS